MYQLRNLLNRSNIKSTPCDVNASEDFLHCLTVGHVVSAAMKFFNIPSMDAAAATDLFPPDLDHLSNDQKTAFLLDIVSKLLKQFLNLDALDDSSNNGAYEYSREMLTLGLFYEEFYDSIREGDGLRVLRCWKFMLLYFKASSRSNYAVTMLAQIHFILPPRLAHQEIWSRFVNVHGIPGRNIPCDLHMEHINRNIKTAIHLLGANCTPKTVVRIGKCVDVVMKASDHFDTETDVAVDSGAHTSKSFSKDLQPSLINFISPSHCMTYILW